MTTSDDHPSQIGGLPVEAVGKAFAIGEAAEHEAEADDLPRLDGFRLVRRLGEGGGGAVYYGFHEGSDRPLAIKVLRARTGEGQGAKRAWRELDILMALRLPCVPRVIDYGQHDGRLFIATEFVEGLPLDRYCDERGLDRRARVALLAKVADAVQSLHEHGVIHRDLKPSNILVDGAGDVTIIDLGVATLLTHDAMETLTQDGAPIGSPAFMAPEQARGERERISTRTDVYGLGAVGYYLLTGQTPFDCSGSLHEVLRKIASQPARAVRELRPDLPRGLAAVLDKAVFVRPQGRYESAAPLGVDLRRWLAGDRVLAQPPARWQRLTRWAARNPIRVTAAVCVMMVAGSVLTSAVANAYFFREPVSMEIVDSGQEARLLSRAGAIVRSWRVQATERVSDPIMVALLTDPQADGQRVMLFSSAVPCELGKDPGAMSCYRQDDLGLRRPVWTTGSMAPQTVAPGDKRAPEDSYNCVWAAIDDVFPAVPGDEIVALHVHFRWGTTAIRVYGLTDGRVLYEAWHDGTVTKPLVVDHSRDGVLLLGQACSNPHLTRPDVRSDSVLYAISAFALRPRLGEIAGWVNRPAEGSSPPRPDVAWYRFVHGPGLYEAASEVRTEGLGLQPRGGGPGGAVAEVAVTVFWARDGRRGKGAHGQIMLGLGRDGALLYAHGSDTLKPFAGVLGGEPWRHFEVRDDPPAR